MPISWSTDLAQYFAAHGSLASGDLYFTQRVLGPLITSFVLLLLPFFVALEKMQRAGLIIKFLLAGADGTEGVEFQGYTFTNLFIIVYRKLEG